jgi:DNA-directed RNA polymerase subunit RPC12/RpoP
MILIKYLLCYRCSKCGIELPTGINMSEYNPEIHKKNCFRCGNKMERWQSTLKEVILVEIKNDMRATGEYYYGRGVYLDLFSFGEESTEARLYSGGGYKYGLQVYG